MGLPLVRQRVGRRGCVVSLIGYRLEDGTEGKVRIKGRDKATWEDRTGGAWYSGPLTHGQLVWVAAAALVREGRLPTVQTFIDTYDDVWPEADDASGPTQTDPSGGP